MHVSPGTVASHLGGTSRSYFYFTTTTLALCLVFTVATIMVLVVQRTDSVLSPPGNSPHKGGNCSDDLLCILERAPFKKSRAYLKVSKRLNSTRVFWNQDGILNGVRYQDGNLVIQFPGLYFIICQLQFLVQCSNHPVDLKLELRVNTKVKREALVTVFLKVLFHECLSVIKNMVNVAAKCHPTESRAQNTITVCPSPPCLLDLALCNLSLIPKVKVTLKSKPFESIQDIKASGTVQTTEEDFLGCFRKWQAQWDKGVASRVGHFGENQ
ncbi:Tumor necrosis factor ligand superfamily member 8 [Fukomys damarensis]|uniref:Tumor necrosis factor ligand superfamily member 8 n=1 Tax=Fukomys damarensis TaxID=885580 RepID=A0A091D6U6_FUKDA|nr:Tumor necrosis factor ligand superfamily member 8 [Fukomys damarensis]